MKSKRLSLEDFKKKASTNNDTLSYAKGGVAVNAVCTGPFRPTQGCHPAAN